MKTIHTIPIGKRPIVELVDLVKNFEDKVVLKSLNLSIEEGEFITLLGPSGSGKTTALRLIGGFEYPTRGEIKFNGVDIKDLPSYKRPTNTIFQDYALFPNLNVTGNIKYGLEHIRVPKQDVSSEIFSKLANLKTQWEEKAENERIKVEKLQKEYETILADQNSPKGLKKKAQRWLDNSDFWYSYWETFVPQKVKAWEDKHTKRRLTKQEIDTKVAKMVNLIGLEGSENKAVTALSGGMKQRVALARSLILEPRVLLLDEPLSALDLKVRQKMQKELKEIQKELALTFIFVTHDQEEAMFLSDKVAVMRDGKIEQFGSPQDIYDEPINAWVARFIGESNIFKAKVLGNNQVSFQNRTFEAETNGLTNGVADIMLRPEDIDLSRTSGYFEGLILSSSYLGILWEYEIEVNDTILLVQSTDKYAEGEKVFLNFELEDIHVMKEEFVEDASQEDFQEYGATDLAEDSHKVHIGADNQNV